MRFPLDRVNAFVMGPLAGLACVLIYLRFNLSPTIPKVIQDYQTNSAVRMDSTPLRRDEMTIVMVTCENRLELSLTNLKSILAFSRASFRLIVYADVKNIAVLQNRILKFPDDILQRFTFDLRLIMFPKKNFNLWKAMFAPCSTQRLFFPDMLPKEDAVLYLDADILLLRPVEELWSIFHQMNGSHLMAQSFEIEDLATNPYRTIGKVPYFEPYGVNSGVMPMNLTRMRRFNWVSRMEPLLEQYGQRLLWADQDIVNIVFNESRHKLFVMPCKWNFRRDNCEYHESCKGEAPALLHANWQLFMNDNEPAFKAAQLAMREYKLGTSLERNFIDPWEKMLKDATRTTICVERFLEYMKDWRAMARQLDTERGLNRLPSKEVKKRKQGKRF